jgi:HK97 gp10 family phage protein
MASFGVKINDDKLMAKLEMLNTQMKSRVIKPALRASALVVQNAGKRNAPYLTGNLRRSITHKVKGNFAKIGTDVVYAAIQEFGGKAGRGKRSVIKGKPYLRPALEKNKEQIQKKFSTILNKLLKK